MGEPDAPCRHFDDMAIWICFGDPSNRILKELNALEVQYIDEYCPDDCTVHSGQPISETLARHRTLCASGYHEAVARTFVKRLANFKASPVDTSKQRRSSQSRIIRLAFTPRCERGMQPQEIRLDRQDLNLVKLLLAEGADPDEMLEAFKGCISFAPPESTPLSNFVYSWLHTKADVTIDDAIWSIVKLLIQHGAKLPYTCTVLDAEYRRGGRIPDLYDWDWGSTDRSWEEYHTEEVSMVQELRWTLPKARRHELDEVLSHAYGSGIEN